MPQLRNTDIEGNSLDRENTFSFPESSFSSHMEYKRPSHLSVGHAKKQKNQI